MTLALLAAAMLAVSPAAPSPSSPSPSAPNPSAQATWTADNGDGTYSNPLFYDEFSDPDVIRVGDDFYMTGTTMHAMPGLPILRSRDLVNWTLVSYAVDRLDLGPAYRLEGGKAIYGQGIWAPSLRHHAGKFYIFSNVNGATTQLFTASDPKGPWTRTPMKRSLHDLSVLFDDDGKAYVVWGYQEIHFAQLDASLTDIVPDTERVLIPKGAGMGEGAHFVKFGQTYFIFSAEWAGMRMAAARATSLAGPWEVNPAISVGEDFGLAKGYRTNDRKPPFRITPPDPSARNWGSLHQGTIVQTPAGEWWGVSMYDANSIGRLTALSPVTWKDGWPYFGLAGNLARTPRTWIKPKSAKPSAPHAPYVRNDDFAGPKLGAVWQWNHVPVDDKWSLKARPGFLRLTSQPATDFLSARNSLTQRAVGPRATATAALDVSGLKPSDVAGLALLNRPYGWIAVERTAEGQRIVRFDEQGAIRTTAPLGKDVQRVWFRVGSDFLAERHTLSWSTDGVRFTPLGEDFTSVFQLITFQGVRYALFAFNTEGHEGGVADFDGFTLDQPDPRGAKPIPTDGAVSLRPVGHADGNDPLAAPVRLVARGPGRVSLERDGQALIVGDDGRATWAARGTGESQVFQWIESLAGDITLMSLKTHRYLRLDPTTNALDADSPGPTADRADGVSFAWRSAQ